MTLFAAFSKTAEIQSQRLVYLKKQKKEHPLVTHGEAAMGLLAPEKPHPCVLVWNPGLPVGCGASLMRTMRRFDTFR